MGCPHAYYKQALQYFAHYLAFDDDSKLAEKMLEEESEEKLENFIIEKKKEIEEIEFFYGAGRVTQGVLDEAEQECCDAFNASIGGLNEFERFLGIGKEKEG